ncbi:MAG TPA: glycosyltransferase family 4 protein [Candidatus Saccharimonadales bacterium]|nr:glycosyltransferase family 4 protein [Candidatus Saccharimonadales bacterium]
MNILWLAWKDQNHPQRGGAELVLHQLIDRQLADGHQVTLLTAQYPGAKAEETLPNGLHIIRTGKNRYLHSAQALVYYLKHLRGKFDLLIETVNTAPYFSLLFKGRAKGFALYHQLARDVWFFETKKPVNWLGYYIIEPLCTWLLSLAKTPLITVSESTKYDMAKFGWKPERTHIISEGITLEPVASLERIKKFDDPTILSFGAIRGMKRTLDQIKAFEIAKQSIPNAKLIVAGDASGSYGNQVLEAISQSPYKSDISCIGRVDEGTKKELMQRAHIITVTSIKEGWGLIVTEAASQGTPAVVYNVDGLRDSVRHGQTGFITASTPQALAIHIAATLKNPTIYHRLQQAAWEWSKQMTFDRSYQDFTYALKEA